MFKEMKIGSRIYIGFGLQLLLLAGVSCFTISRMTILSSLTSKMVSLRVGKGVATATPSPLSQWGQFSIFTSMTLSVTGRPHIDCPFRGVS